MTGCLLSPCLSVRKEEEMKAGVVGAAGYAGIECIRILLGHPGFEVVYASSDADAGRHVSDLYPSLIQACDLSFEPLDVAAIVDRCEIVFLAVPHTASLAITPRLLAAGLIVIDLSADYRLKDPAVYEEWYGVPHTSPELLAQAVYGLPEENLAELQRLARAEVRLVACAGCYPTASALSVLPVAHAGLLTGTRVISDCLSGVSGAGRRPAPTSSFVSADANANAYGVTTHRHTPEIAQTLSLAAGHDVPVVFTPHLVPLKRGILATVYLDVVAGTTQEGLQGLYEGFYAECPFVHVLPAGTMPRMAAVSGGNEAQLSVSLDRRTGTAVVCCAIDNLVKGAAGQAVQCANIVTGQPQTTGLRLMYPPVV